MNGLAGIICNLIVQAILVNSYLVVDEFVKIELGLLIVVYVVPVVEMLGEMNFEFDVMKGRGEMLLHDFVEMENRMG